jgi:hypothetical protein
MPLESVALDPRSKTELCGADEMRGNAGLTLPAHHLSPL